MEILLFAQHKQVSQLKEVGGGGEKYELEIFKIKEGYSNIEENHILFGMFSGKESYFTENSEYPGAYDYEITFSKNGPVMPNDCIETNYGWGKSPDRKVSVICQELVENIEKENKKAEVGYANLGVKYRPTMDLGLYNDVQEAFLDINNKQETFIYDKRAANGGAFKFGVNEYDINNSQNPEDMYASYYNNLSNGITNENLTNATDLKYEDLRQKEDIFQNTTIGQTENGIAEAGGYNEYPITIRLTYKIRVINQSGVESEVTEVVDYYSNDFKFIGAYEDKEGNQELQHSDQSRYSDRGAKATQSRYNSEYIKLNKSLANNESTYIYVVLEMINPRASLNGKLEPGGEGYKTINFAEINGYKTKIGVLDVDSIPGNLIEDGRFENGQYEDDESKSPTFIIRNPGDKERIIEGTLFEDATGKDLVQSYTNQERSGDGKLQGDTPIVGGIVQLLEFDENGNIIKTANDNGTGIRAQTYTDSNGNYKFTKITPGNYKVQFIYGYDDKTALLANYNGGSNAKSYNGQDFENTIQQNNSENKYWYIEDMETRNSDANDIRSRRDTVIKYSTTLTNHISEVFNSWKDRQPNRDLVNELERETWMNAQTKLMSLEVENIRNYENRMVENAGDKTVTDYEYDIKNVDFGIVERQRAELQIIKKISKISIVDSSGTEITGGKAGEDIKYVKWIQGPDGFLDMEIDQELLSGATLIITYEITVTNNSEKGNTISNIQVIDYVSNNLNYDGNYGENGEYGWKPITTEKAKEFVNNTSLNAPNDNTANKIDLSTYQTILMTEFDRLEPTKSQTKTLTLEKNLSAQEESDFNYENQVEIVQSYNEIGRGDYSSIYGNLDPETYTSKQGNLNWDGVTEENKYQYGFSREKTVTSLDDPVTGNTNAIREAEKDSGNAEEVIITPPTGAKGIVLQTYHYVLALIALITTAIGITIIKKHIKIQH